MEYTVTWTIELEADTPREAAEKALVIHRDPESIATVFSVRGDSVGLYEIDLSPSEG